MNTTRDPDRRLQAWLDLMPDEAPDRVISAVLQATEHAPQRRDVLGPALRRFFPMNRLPLAAAAAVILAVVAGGALLFGAGPDIGNPPATVTPTSTETAPASPIGTAAATPNATAAEASYSCGTRRVTWDGSSAIDLTGTWHGNDGGVYYVRHLGDQVWWLGMSGLGGPLVRRGVDWTNVYLGTLSGDTITGTYADVPHGQIRDKGPVVMKLTPTSGGGISLVRIDPVLSTGFGGTRFTPCSLG